MRFWRFQFVRLLALALLAGCVSLPAYAQRGLGQGKNKKQQRREEARENRRAAENQKNAIKENKEERQLMGVPAPWMERLQRMTLVEQERFFNNNERFRNLPPERQAQIRRRLDQWNRLTPEQRQAMVDRERIWQQLTPEQQRHVREEVLPRWKQLPPDRRQPILRRLHALQNLSESEREAKLNDEAFMRGLNPEDRSMLRELTHLRVGLPEPPAPNP